MSCLDLIDRRGVHRAALKERAQGLYRGTRLACC